MAGADTESDACRGGVDVHYGRYDVAVRLATESSADAAPVPDVADRNCRNARDLRVAAAYWAAARQWLLLRRQPVASGAAYGLLLYVLMNYFVVPLSAASSGSTTLYGLC